MKRPKMFLSVTTCLLGIAAIVATKANDRTFRIGCTKTGAATQVSCVTISGIPGGRWALKCTNGSALTLYTCLHFVRTLYVISE